jgi:CRP-like cAMP-binding protein
MDTLAIASARERSARPISPRSLGSLEDLAIVTRFKRGQGIYLCEDAAGFWYRIITGAGRKCVFTLDGNRQIVDFLRPGDLFGVDEGEIHQFSVEAIVAGAKIARYPRYRAELLADSDPQVARRIRELAFESVSRVHRRMVILGRASALEKVSTFLLEMTDRFGAGSSSAVTLPMSRYDIADYLAMAVETVSRALTNLRERGVIQFSAVRCVQICDRDALDNVFRSPYEQVRIDKQALRKPLVCLEEYASDCSDG